MATIYYMAQCRECSVLPPPDEGLPFDDENTRDEWALTHAEGTGHTVDLRETVR